MPSVNDFLRGLDKKKSPDYTDTLKGVTEEITKQKEALDVIFTISEIQKRISDLEKRVKLLEE